MTSEPSRHPCLLPTTLAAVLILSACAGGTGGRNVRELLPVEVIAPSEPPGFGLEGMHRDQDPRVGNQLRYVSSSHPELVADAFVYLGGTYADFDHAATGLGHEMVESLADAQRNGLLQELEILDDHRYEVETRYGDNTGRHLRFAFRRDGDEYISHAHLFYVPPYSFKFRSSFPSYGNTSFDQQIDLLVRGFMSEVAIAEAIRCRKQITVNLFPGDGEAWSSMDGMDIFIPENSDGEAFGQLLMQSMLDGGRYMCPERTDDPLLPQQMTSPSAGDEADRR